MTFSLAMSAPAENHLQILLEAINGRRLIDANFGMTFFGPSVTRALVIGGFLRDEVFRLRGRRKLASRDIDILISGGNSSNIRTPANWIKLAPSAIRRPPASPFLRALRGEDLCGYGTIQQISIHSLGYYKAPHVDLAVNLLHCDVDIHAPQYLAEALDFGINQIAYDGKYLYASDVFHQDFTNKTLTWSGKRTSGAARTHAETRAVVLAKRLKLTPVWPEARHVA